MPEALSVDLRKRIVQAYERGGVTRDLVAEQFQVGRATVNRLITRFRKTGSLEPSPHAGGRTSIVTPKAEKALLKLLEERADATLPELIDALRKKTGLIVSTSTMGRALVRLGLTRKKRPSSQPNKARPTSKRFATAFVPGRAPWTLEISSSSTRRDPKSG